MAPGTGKLQAELFKYGGDELKKENYINGDQSMRSKRKAIRIVERDYMSTA